MSHFTVLVNARDEEHLEELLAPYEESPDEGSPYLTFEDKTEEYKQEWETLEIEMYQKEGDDKYYFAWDEKFRVNNSIGTTFSATNPSHNPESFGYTKIAVQVQKHYKTFDEFVSDYHGDRKQADGRYGYWHNENAKWDWWVVGGRWAETLLTKHGEKVSECPLSELDIEGMRKQSAEDNVTQWDSVEIALDEAKTIWKNGKDDPRFSALRERISATTIFNLADILEYASREECYQNGYEDSLSFALLDSNGWLQRGQMGWWACVSDENPNYVNQYYERLAKWTDGNVYIVDCHI